MVKSAPSSRAAGIVAILASRRERAEDRREIAPRRAVRRSRAHEEDEPIVRLAEPPVRQPARDLVASDRAWSNDFGNDGAHGGAIGGAAEEREPLDDRREHGRCRFVHLEQGGGANGWLARNQSLEPRRELSLRPPSRRASAFVPFDAEPEARGAAGGAPARARRADRGDRQESDDPEHATRRAPCCGADGRAPARSPATRDSLSVATR